MLLEKNMNVVGMDTINNYYDPKLKEWRLRQLELNSKS
jgi:hypothetical protein